MFKMDNQLQVEGLLKKYSVKRKYYRSRYQEWKDFLLECISLHFIVIFHAISMLELPIY